MVNEISDWWFGTCFPHILGIVITPTDDFYIFFRGIETTNQKRTK
jgi:hypothetical protein